MSAQTIDALRNQVTGPVIAPGDPGYDEARRVYNYMIDRHPAAVVQCTGAADVAAVVRHAAETGTELAVRGGAHSVPGFGTADGALVAQPMDELAKLGIATIADRIERKLKGPPRTTLVGVRLVTRMSTSPPSTDS